MLAAWGLGDTVADDPAQAAAPARPCLLGDLLDDADRILSIFPVGTPPAPPDSRPEGEAARVGGASDPRAAHLAKWRGRSDAPVPSRHQRPAARQAPVRDRPAVPPVRRAPQATVRPAVDPVVAAAAPVTGPVVDLASPVVAAISGTGLLDPVRSVVGPVAEPIVDVLPPALDPMLDLTRPIIGAPAAPTPPPGDPVATTPPTASAGAPPVTAPATIARPEAPVVAGYPVPPSPERRSPSAGRGEPAGNAAAQAWWPGEPGHGPGVAPAGPARTAASGSAPAGPGAPADAYPSVSAPDLHPLELCVGGCDALAERAQQPDPRPA
ncbi:hypothetical protein ONA91_11485 [Micromonospora sp. DR5-3]|uniref:hypothetical protein n=1 Tax=unclassified Micromonospora TaxID=2617518 RepID=UPI0011D5BCB7|nr:MULTISPECIES: hypothetical protein [unclassified Micromonospora]MCW3815078.1 hypothetical protein [Micromonospora sp. DR5-3]TYC25389.1 hypothetical protein FXF52_06235 [Micromonospora sp. MP36]